MSVKEVMARALSIVERGKKLSHEQQWKIFWMCFESVEAYPTHYGINYKIDPSIHFLKRPEAVRNDIIEKGYFHFLEYYVPDIIETDGELEAENQISSFEDWCDLMDKENDLALCQSLLFEIADRAGLTLCETHMVETTHGPCPNCEEEPCEE